MKGQAFGIEIELTGITREQAAQTIATHFGTSPIMTMTISTGG